MVIPARKCPACNADLEIGCTECTYCGSQVVQVALSFREREEVNRLAKRLNAQLNAEQGRLLRLMDLFLLMICILGVLLSLILWLLLKWLTEGWMILVLFPVAFYLLRELLKRSYLQGRYFQVFLKDIEPQMRHFILERNIPRWQFDQMADYALPGDAPLRIFLLGKPQNKK